MPAAVENAAPEAEEEEEEEEEEERKRLPAASANSAKADQASFVGKSFQEAQDMIIEEMIRLKNEEYVIPLCRSQMGSWPRLSQLILSVL
jgi:hypothetical protein